MGFFTKNWDNSKDVGLLVLRIVLGLCLFYGHGFDKLSTIITGQDIQFANPLGIGAIFSFYLAALAEGLCSLLLIFGVLTRRAALILTLNFLVILFYHAVIIGDGFPVLELRLLYFAGFLALTFLGAGKYSFDYQNSTDNELV